ncbi:MAG: hypothetical protein R2770_02240 [Acidimicrobiales bacterium]|nr:hypothetical protein [Acidimicrobiales bacterium]
MTEAAITMRIPAQTRFVGVARVTAASLAADLGFSVDGIDDVVAGVNELVAMLIEWAEDNGCQTMALQFTLTDDELRADVHVEDADRVPASPEPDILDDLARRILDRVVDEYHIDGPSGWVRRGLQTP